MVALSCADAGIDAAMVDDARRLIANEVRTGNCMVTVIDEEGLRCQMVIEKGRERKGISLSTYIFGEYYLESISLYLKPIINEWLNCPLRCCQLCSGSCTSKQLLSMLI